MKAYTLENDYIKVEFLAQGGTIRQLVKKQTNTNYVLHYHAADLYKKNPYYLGALIGRNAGRTFPPYYINTNGEKVKLDINEGNVHLHGGYHGFHLAQWQVDKKQENEYILTYQDDSTMYEPASFTVSYKLDDHHFIIDMKGTAPQPTVMNLTNHSYFNLNKDKTKGIENHYMKIGKSSVQIIDEHQIPTESYADSQEEEYKDFHFEQEKQVKEAFHQGTNLSSICQNGIDLAYCFQTDSLKKPQIELWADNKENGLRIYTNQEACVIYTFNKVDEPIPLNEGIQSKAFMGMTFEMQQRPNYVHSNQKGVLTTNYHSYTKYEFL